MFPLLNTGVCVETNEYNYSSLFFLQSMKKKLGETQAYLQGLYDNKDKYLVKANEQQKAALNNLHGHIEDLKAFGTSVR